MFTKATKAVNRILHQDFTDSRSSYLNTVQSSTICSCLCNRDSQWVGPGQLQGYFYRHILPYSVTNSAGLWSSSSLTPLDIP